MFLVGLNLSKYAITGKYSEGESRYNLSNKAIQAAARVSRISKTLLMIIF